MCCFPLKENVEAKIQIGGHGMVLKQYQSPIESSGPFLTQVSKQTKHKAWLGYQRPGAERSALWVMDNGVCGHRRDTASGGSIAGGQEYR